MLFYAFYAFYACEITTSFYIFYAFYLFYAFYAFCAFYSFYSFYSFYACEITLNNLIYYATCFMLFMYLIPFCAYKKYLGKNRLFNVFMLFIMSVKYLCKKSLNLF